MKEEPSFVRSLYTTCRRHYVLLWQRERDERQEKVNKS
eukprot:COSAG06_NODE_14698_length_1134_cov_1.253140_2_plen_37_part_01